MADPTVTPVEPARPRTKRRAVKIIAILLALPVLAGLIWVGSLGASVNNIAREDLLGVDDGAPPTPIITGEVVPYTPPAPADENADEGGAVPFDPEDVTGQVGEGDDALIIHKNPEPVDQPDPATINDGNSLNFLIIGSDSRNPGSSAGRSDVIIVAHVNSDRTRVDLVHFPRDYYVNVPGYGKNKINAAYAHGGTPLLAASLQPLIGVPFDHVAVTNFTGFQRMVDAVGGLDVYVHEGSPKFPTEGQMTRLDTGSEALQFVRERKTLRLGDLGRGVRQQEFIKRLMLEATSSRTLTNPVRLDQLVRAATSNLTVDRNLSTSAMTSLAFEMRDIRGGSIHAHTAPNNWARTVPGAGSVIVVDEAGLARLRNAYRNDAFSGY